jgi:hypothetical protein
MKQWLILGGLGIAAVTNVTVQFLPGAPASIQSDPTLQPIGSFLINNQTILTILGLVLILVGLFL